MVLKSNNKVKIKSVKRKSYNGLVYNIGVEGDESYTANGYKVNNCRGFWIAIFDKEDIEGSVGLPKFITDKFETVGGAPITNAFTQIKKK